MFNPFMLNFPIRKTQKIILILCNNSQVPKILGAHLVIWEVEEFQPEPQVHTHWESSWHNIYGPGRQILCKPMPFYTLCHSSIQLAHLPTLPVPLMCVFPSLRHFFWCLRTEYIKHHSRMQKFMRAYISSQSRHHGSVSFCIKLSHTITP